MLDDFELTHTKLKLRQVVNDLSVNNVKHFT